MSQMPTLTKADIVESLTQKLGLNAREARDLVEIFFEEIRSNLENGNPVKLSGFGNFNLRNKKARPGRNPKTGKDVLITPRRVVTFHTGQKLQFRIAQYAGDKAHGRAATK